MSEKHLKESMKELMSELGSAEDVDQTTAEAAKQLESDIHDLVNPEVDSSENTVMDDAISLEATFAVNHPVAEKIIRELINSLSRIGI